MKTFNEAWDDLSRDKYLSGIHRQHNEQLDAVKAGWELAMKTIYNSAYVSHYSAKEEREERERMARIKYQYEAADKYEAEGKYELAADIRPCCPNEKRGWGGGCSSCGSPCF